MCYRALRSGFGGNEKKRAYLSALAAFECRVTGGAAILYTLSEVTAQVTDLNELGHGWLHVSWMAERVTRV